MRREAILAIICGILLSGCGGDLVAPFTVAGRYTFLAFRDVYEDPIHPTNPFLGPSPTIVLDSVLDTVVLASDNTYRENGGMWGHDVISSPNVSVLFQGQGTYTLNHSSVTLIQSNGVTVTGGTGSIVRDTLKVTRYPGTWVFVKE
jgi:hypothetical protein